MIPDTGTDWITAEGESVEKQRTALLRRTAEVCGSQRRRS